MSVTFRDARTSDLAPLASFARETYVAAFGHTFTPGDLTAHLNASLSQAHVAEWLAEDSVLLATDDGRLAGFAHAGPIPEGLFEGFARPGDAALWRLYVAPDLHGHGIGRRLLEAALAVPALATAPNVYLDVWEENHGAQRLYGRYGFRTVGRRPLETESGAGAGYDLIMARARA
ncbi:MAG TPA: N-acetyltransferase [Phenylobacterium sp.]|jgi:ribosomal protein S18 acetylase RimI-like enzyme